jgi:hypothetical protein
MFFLHTLFHVLRKGRTGPLAQRGDVRSACSRHLQNDDQLAGKNKGRARAIGDGQL